MAKEKDMGILALLIAFGLAQRPSPEPEPEPEPIERDIIRDRIQLCTDLGRSDACCREWAESFDPMPVTCPTAEPPAMCADRNYSPLPLDGSRRPELFSIGVLGIAPAEFRATRCEGMGSAIIVRSVSGNNITYLNGFSETVSDDSSRVYATLNRDGTVHYHCRGGSSMSVYNVSVGLNAEQLRTWQAAYDAGVNPYLALTLFGSIVPLSCTDPAQNNQTADSCCRWVPP